MEQFFDPTKLSVNLLITFLLGGLCLFLYGMDEATKGLKQYAGNKLKVIISNLTSNRFLAVVIGFFVTIFTQSSSATSVMLVGFANAGLITLRQSIPVLLGADIGTTIVVQLIAFRVARYSLLMIAVGFFFRKVGKETGFGYFGRILMGFGIIFFGMNLMTVATMPLKDTTIIVGFLKFLESNLIWAIALSVIFTAIIQSSAATIGIVLSLSMGGNISLVLAIPLVLGANLGTSITAVIAAFNSNLIGKRIAAANVIIKVFGIIIFIPFLKHFEAGMAFISGDINRQIANTHTSFNLMLTAIVLPLLFIFIFIVKKLFPKNILEEDKTFKTKYLDKSALDTPSLAFGQATREILRMSDIVKDMFKKSILVFKTNDENIVNHLEEQDDKVDFLNKRIKFYLTGISRNILSETEGKREVGLISFTSDLETIGDIINKNIMELARKKIRKNVRFSSNGLKEIVDFHEKVLENFELAMSAFATNNIELARKVIRHKEHLALIERELNEAHIERLHAGLKETHDTTGIHLELLSHIRRINSHISEIAYPIVDNVYTEEN